MARRSWKKSGVQKFVDGGMPQYGGQFVRESPEIEAQKRGLMQAQMGMPQQGPQPPPFLGQRMPSPVQTMAIPSSAYEPSWLAERRQAQANTGSQMPPQGGTLPYERMPSLAPRATRPQMSPPGMPTQGMPPQGMRPQRASMPAQQTQPQMPNMDKYMQMVQSRQQDMAQRGITPQELPSADMLRQMPTDQVRQLLGQTVLGPQGMQQLQQQAAKAGGIRPTEMQYLRNPMQAAQQAMGMQQRPAPQASMGQQAMGMQQPQQNMSRAMSGGAMPRVSGFAEGGSIDSRMAELDRYLRDPNLKMVRTKNGLFQFVPINAPKKAAPKPMAKPAAKPAAKAEAKPAANRAAANAVPGARGKQKTGGGSIPSINRPLSAFTGSKTKPVKPTGMTRSTPLPRDMTGVNQTPIRGRDIAGAMAKGAATGLAMGMGPGALGAGRAMLGKGIDKGLRAARKPLTESRMSATLARTRPGEVVPRLPSSTPTAARMGSKTTRIPKPKATEYKAPAPKAGAAKRAAEALKRREVTAEEAMDMMKGYKHGGPPKKAPRGMHYMPDGRLMKNSAHKKGRK